MRFPEIVALTSALALVAAAPADLSPQTAGTIEPRVDASSGLTNSDKSSGKDLFARENMLGMSDEAAIAADEAAADAEAASAEDADDDWDGDSPHWDDPGKDNIDPFDHCVKGEVGCHQKDAWVGYVFGILPIMRALIKHKKDRLNLRRYDVSIGPLVHASSTDADCRIDVVFQWAEGRPDQQNRLPRKAQV